MVTLQEKLEAIRVYDNEVFHNSRRYLTSLDWLHPVAMKVRVAINVIWMTHLDLSLMETSAMKIHIANIEERCHYEPNSNGEYTDLFNAVYEGILFINQYKK